MAIILGLLVTIPAIFFIALPFFKITKPEQMKSVSSEMDQIHSEREAIYKQLETLQLEHDIGQFPSSEYEGRVWTLRLEAAENLQRQSRFLKINESLPKEIVIEMETLHKSELNESLEPRETTAENHCDDDDTNRLTS